MRHNLTILCIAALSLFCSCNKMETIQNPDGSITVTASVSMAQTKALTNTGTKTFAVNDQLAVIYKQEGGGTAVAISEKLISSNIRPDGKSAKFRVTFTDPDKTESVTYVYPANMAKNDGNINYDALYSDQNGTLSKIASDFDLCTKVVSWSGSSLPEGQTLVNQLTVAQFTLRDSAIEGDPGNITSSLTGLTITNGSDEYSVSLSSNTTVWVAMKPITTGDIVFAATDGSNNYTKTVKSQTMYIGTLYSDITVSMNKVPSIPTGAIDGLFSVSSTKQVYFSQGNLQYQASTGTWRFAEHQYDFIGGGNFFNDPSNPEWIDLYCWGTSGIDYTGHATLYLPWVTAYYSEIFNPYSSLTTNLYDGEGENAGKADWGYNAISNGGNTQNSGWRTLKNNTTDNEWQYIFNSRTTANEINSTSNARYTQARINIDDWAVRGIILFPDGSIGDTPSGVTWGTINAAASSWTTGTTQCTTAGWAALEAAGCVFLPAAGKGDPSGVSQAEIEGYYWSSSYANSEKAYGMYFYSNKVSPQYSEARNYNLSVRLVKDAN